jgi:hypothetical protein
MLDETLILFRMLSLPLNGSETMAKDFRGLVHGALGSREDMTRLARGNPTS